MNLIYYLIYQFTIMGNKKSKTIKTIDDKIKFDKGNDINQKNVPKVIRQDEPVVEAINTSPKAFPEKNKSVVKAINTSPKAPPLQEEYDKCIETHIQCGITYHRCVLCFKPAHYYAKFNPYCSQCITNFETYSVPLYCRADENCVKRKKHNPTQCVLCNGQYANRYCQLCGYNSNDLDLCVAYHWTIPSQKDEESFIQTVRICKLCCDDKNFSLDPRLTIITNEPATLPILLS